MGVSWVVPSVTSSTGHSVFLELFPISFQEIFSTILIYSSLRKSLVMLIYLVFGSFFPRVDLQLNEISKRIWPDCKVLRYKVKDMKQFSKLITEEGRWKCHNSIPVARPPHVKDFVDFIDSNGWRYRSLLLALLKLTRKWPFSGLKWLFGTHNSSNE